MKPIRTHIESLTGLRFIAAYLVFFGHLMDQVSGRLQHKIVPFGASEFSYIGMTLFFCLSGFVIYYNYSVSLNRYSAKNTYNFLIARLARLYPLFIVTLIIYTGFNISGYFRIHPYGLASFLTLTQSWIAAHGIAYVPAWTISSEMFFYLCYILAAPLLTKIPPRATFPSFIAYMVAIPVLFHFGYHHQEAVVGFFEKLLPKAYRKDIWPWLTYNAPYIRVAEFFAGALACKVYLDYAPPAWLTRHGMLICLGIGLGLLAALGCFMLNSAGVIHLREFWVTLRLNFYYALFIIPLILAMAMSGNHWINRLFGSRIMVHLGELSFSIYLIQHWAFTMMNSWTGNWGILGPKSFFVTYLILCSAMTYYVSYGTYYTIEVPGRRLIRRLQTGRKPRLASSRPSLSAGVL